MKHPLILAALLASGAAHAEFISGNDLLQRMTGEPLERTFAMGYVAGVYDTTVTLIHCAPANVTLRQVTDTVQRGLEVMPATRHKSADYLVNQILKVVWPCAEKPKNDSRGVL
jgi:hypothetical protein